MTRTTTKTVVSSVSLLVLFSMTTACVNLAPQYERPSAPIAANYDLPDYYKTSISSDNNVLETQATAPPILTIFLDKRLQGLINLALENNRDLRTATLNIAKARAQYGVQDAATFPTINAEGIANTSRMPADLSTTGRSQINRQYSISLGTTAYEVDFFGRVKNLKSQALEQFYATEEARQTVLISLVAEVTNTWFNWYADTDSLTVSQNLLNSQRETLSLIQKRFDIGDITALTLHQQEVAVANAQADVERLISQTAKDRNALTLLLGTLVPEESSPTILGKAITLYDGKMLTTIPVGLPSDLMLRRPDILESEHRLKAANANIGVARAAFYPSISLTANAGLSSTALSGLFKSGSGAWAFAPQINLPIFDGGANKANLKIAETERDIALSSYEKSIQTAFREVSDALVERASIGKQLEVQNALLEASGKTFELTKARYDNGIDSWLDVLNAQRSYTSAHTELINLYAQQLKNSITLYKVLGGGWNSEVINKK